MTFKKNDCKLKSFVYLFLISIAAIFMLSFQVLQVFSILYLFPVNCLVIKTNELIQMKFYLGN